MFPLDTPAACLAAVPLAIVAAGPDNILAIGRCPSQGRVVAILSSMGAGLDTMFQTVGATLGPTQVIQASPAAFWAVKRVGAGHLLWLDFRVVTSRSLISFTPTAARSLRRVFATGLFSNVLDPKPGPFVLAFIPQFIGAGAAFIESGISILALGTRR